MKSLGFILSSLTRPPHRRNLRVVGWLVLSLLVLVVFMPWMASREAARAPRELPEGTAGHIVLARRCRRERRW